MSGKLIKDLVKETSLSEEHQILVSDGDGEVLKRSTISDLKNTISGTQLPLLSTMWADHILNDVSWIRADIFSWQSGDVYTSVYNELSSQAEEWLETHDYRTDYETENGVNFWRTSKGYKIAIYDGNEQEEQRIIDCFNNTGVAWFYLLDRVNKRFKLPRQKDRTLIESGKNSNGWYRLYSDGWVEQGAYLSGEYKADAKFTIPLAIEMKDNNYYYTALGQWDDGNATQNWGSGAFYLSNRTTTNFVVIADCQQASTGMTWEVKGYTNRNVDYKNKYLYFYMGNYNITPSTDISIFATKEYVNNIVGNIETQLAEI